MDIPPSVIDAFSYLVIAIVGWLVPRPRVNKRTRSTD